MIDETNLRLLRLIQNIYSNVKVTINNEKIKSKDMKSFLNKHFTVSGSWIGPKEGQSFEIALQENDLIDSYPRSIEDATYDPETIPASDLEIEWYDGADIMRWQSGIEEDGTPIFDIPVYRFEIPKFLIDTYNEKYIAEFITQKYFPKPILEKGFVYQSYQSYFRLISYLKVDLTILLETLKQIRGKNEEDKMKILEKVFYILGYEILKIDALKEDERFKKLKNLSNPDLVLYSLYTKELILVEEKPSLNNKHFQKLFLINPIFEVFAFLGDPDEWEISMIVISSLSEVLKSQITDIASNKRIVICSHERFFSFFEQFVNDGINIYSNLGFRNLEYEIIKLNNIFRNSFLSLNKGAKYLN